MSTTEWMLLQTAVSIIPALSRLLKTCDDTQSESSHIKTSDCHYSRHLRHAGDPSCLEILSGFVSARTLLNNKLYDSWGDSDNSTTLLHIKWKYFWIVLLNSPHFKLSVFRVVTGDVICKHTNAKLWYCFQICDITVNYSDQKVKGENLI